MSQLSQIGLRDLPLVLEGELDIAAWPRVRAVLAPALGATSGVVVIDTSAVAFVDCAGLRPLVDVALQLRTRGVHTRLPSPSPPVERLVVLTRLDRLLELTTCGQRPHGPGAGPAPGPPARR